MSRDCPQRGSGGGGRGGGGGNCYNCGQPGMEPFSVDDFYYDLGVEKSN